MDEDASRKDLIINHAAYPKTYKISYQIYPLLKLPNQCSGQSWKPAKNVIQDACLLTRILPGPFGYILSKS